MRCAIVGIVLNAESGSSNQAVYYLHKVKAFDNSKLEL